MRFGKGRGRRNATTAALFTGILTVAAMQCSAALITFSDQNLGTSVDEHLPMQRGSDDGSLYSSAQGLPTGVTATFAGFYRNPTFSPDHTPSPNNDNKMVAGLSDSIATTITFNVPVEVKSFFVRNDSGDAGLGEGQFDGATATLGMTVVWSYQATISHTFSGSAASITAGAGKAIDKITFFNFANTELDDITINAIPEPATTVSAWVILTLKSLGGFDRRIRRSK
jgi:hypothetical protein